MTCNLTSRQRWQYAAGGVALLLAAALLREPAWARVVVAGLGLVIAIEGAAGY